MKRLYTERSWIEANERRRKRKERRHLARRRRRDVVRERRRSKKRRQITEFPEVVMSVGASLDPMDPTSAAVRVCASIRENVRRGEANVYVDLSELEVFTLAGVILLSASIGVGKAQGARTVRVRGNVPKERSVASDFMASGFFGGFEDRRGALPESKARWTSASQKKVASEKAAQLVEFAEEQVGLSVEQQRAVSQNLVECMTNTTNHAGGGGVQGTVDGDVSNMEAWIAGVRCDGKEAQFAFVDLGVGICASAEATTFLKRARQTLGLYGADRLVKESFDGTLGSSTRSKGRGLGLPRMRRDCSTGLLEDLEVRTGSVRGKIGSMDFEGGQDEMTGTILTWLASGAGRGGEL